MREVAASRGQAQTTSERLLAAKARSAMIAVEQGLLPHDRSMMPKAHFATVYAKPKGRPLVDTFVTEVSQDTWIYFPWDMGFTYQKPIADDHAG